ncbi:MAG: NAD(P)-binding protein [Thermoleophilia bacterium]
MNKVLPLEEREIIALNDTGRCPVYVRRMPPCKDACPSSEDIRGYLTQLAQTDLLGRTTEESLDEAWHILTDKNPFPAVHGRICPHPCETACNRRIRDWPLAINNLERFIGDHGIRRGLGLRKLASEVKTQRVAVVGAGPAGLSCAYQLARRGYLVRIFESGDQPGGALRTGIPHYRLPRDVLDAEIGKILDLGIVVRYGVLVGRDVSLDKLRDEYDAVFAGIGAQAGIRLGIEGEDLPGVFSGFDFLKRVNSGQLKQAGEATLVIGGGNAAIDAARAAVRLGGRTTIAYRRTRFEMPSISEEVWEAEQEGVGFEFQVAPVKIARTDGGPQPLEVTFIRMEPGEPDESGRKRPVPVPGSEFALVADMVVAALGQQPDFDGIEGIGGDDGWAAIKPSRESNLPGVFVGGDMLATGLATTAVGQGRGAARAIVEFLNGRTVREPYMPSPIQARELRLDYYDHLPRNDHEYLLPEERTKNFDEVNLPLSAEAALAETRRCMSCGLCLACDRCRIYCCEEAINRNLKRPQGRVMFTDYARCVGCGTCAEACPCHYIEMGYGV